jgi:membrane-associated protease RseP (regulator of RpoE activity)
VEPAREEYPGLLTPEVDVRYSPRPKFKDRGWLHVLLFMATFVVTTFMGADQYAAFLQDFNLTAALPLTLPALVLRGFWYSVTILLILGCHEMGHYLACRYYDVDASLPFFIPAPFVMTGTLGAFIRIREPIQQKHVLFDIGIAGPIAGFLVAVPALFIGVAMSHVARVPPNAPGQWEIGEPLLFKLAEAVFWGSTPDGYSLNMHPVAFAAWFGLLATALNLFPIGQLDGGHISYAVFGRRSTYITFAAIGVAAVLVYVASSWLVWTALMITMLVLFGPRHPPVADEHVPLDRTRLYLALFALLMFVLCFTPAPIRPSAIIGH